MWKNMVWWSKQSLKIWKTFWEWPQSLTAKTLSSDKSNNTVDGKFHDDQQNISELTVVKKLWALASWHQCWKSHNVFILRLGSEWDIGRYTNCVAAIHSPRQPFFNEPIQKRGEPQELFKFAVEKNLQITFPINHSDFGQRNGSEDAFPKLWSNKHYFGT